MATIPALEPNDPTLTLVLLMGATRYGIPTASIKSNVALRSEPSFDIGTSATL